MQTQSTTITTDSSTTAESNPFQTPIKKKASGANTNALNTSFIQAQRVNHNVEPKTDEEFLARIFSPENIKEAKNISYNNNAYLQVSQMIATRKRRFIAFEGKIDQKYPFLRYTTDKLKELLDDANDADKAPKAPSSEDENIQHQAEMLLQITNSVSYRTPLRKMESAPLPIQPIGNLPKPIEKMTVSLTPQTNANNKIKLPQHTVRPQLFRGEPTAGTQESGPILNESLIEQAPIQISDCTPVKHKFPYLCNSTSTLPSSPFEGDTMVQFRFVIGSSLEEETLFAIGHDDSRMSHGQLAAKTEYKYVSCNAAGIIGFEKYAGKWLIKTVSNKTGHFKCGPESFLTTIGMLFTDFSDYLSEEITLNNESLENPKDKKSFTFAVSDLKKRYEDGTRSAALVTPQSDISNTAENITKIDANPLFFFSTPKKQKPNVSSFSARDNELVQLPQSTDGTQTDQPRFELL
ncbi:MAG: hypothetical protein P4L79_17710 [Legionella sp.]|uniref:hypothetical protein n=1 Tax=Legionella sp. TaxID=459 RepID=UPI00284B0946|nr:hypothetical protein [Legionella sp.]